MYIHIADFCLRKELQIIAFQITIMYKESIDHLNPLIFLNVKKAKLLW